LLMISFQPPWLDRVGGLEELREESQITQ
jgi:hypothetical protein